MAMAHKGIKVAGVLVVVGIYLVLQRQASLPKAPAIEPEAAHLRDRFPVDFIMPDLEGTSVRLSDLRGQVVLLNFWATWCYPCRTEMPSMQALYQDYRERGLEILAIASDGQGMDVVAPFVDAHGLTFPVLLDPQNVVGARLFVQAIPMSYLLDKDGRIAGREPGAKNWNSRKMRRLLDRLLDEETPTTVVKDR
jgi:peroxiredoxin